MRTEVAAGRCLRHPQFAIDGSVRGFFRCQSERSRFPLGCLISWGHFLCALGHLRAFWTRGRPLDRCLRLELAGEALEQQDRWRANDRGGDDSDRRVCHIERDGSQRDHRTQQEEPALVLFCSPGGHLECGERRVRDDQEEGGILPREQLDLPPLPELGQYEAEAAEPAGGEEEGLLREFAPVRIGCKRSRLPVISSFLQPPLHAGSKPP